MTSNYILGCFLRKVGLRIGWSDEGRVGHRGREGALRDALFDAMKHRAENGNEELPAFLSEGIAKRAVCCVGRDGLQTDRRARLSMLIRQEKTLKSSYDGKAS
jgi:hypothetical protein